MSVKPPPKDSGYYVIEMKNPDSGKSTFTVVEIWFGKIEVPLVYMIEIEDPVDWDDLGVVRYKKLNLEELF